MKESKKIGSFKDYCYEQKMLRLNEAALTITCDWWDEAIVEVMQDLANETNGPWNWEDLVKYVETKNSILGRSTPSYPENAVLQHIKELIFIRHGGSFFQDDQNWMDWDNVTLHSKGLVIEELAGVILDKVKEKTNQSNDKHTLRLMDPEPTIMVPMTPVIPDEECCDDLPFEGKKYAVKDFEDFLAEKKVEKKK